MLMLFVVHKKCCVLDCPRSGSDDTWKEDDLFCALPSFPPAARPLTSFKKMVGKLSHFLNWFVFLEKLRKYLLS